MEIWKPIPTFENYEASNLGRIRNNYRILKGYKNRSGYINHTLIDDNSKIIKIDAHIIVCITFHGQKPHKTYTVDHINNIKDDNCITNLRWASKSEQISNIIRKEKSSRSIEMVNLKTNEVVHTFEGAKEASKTVSLYFKTIRNWIDNKSKHINNCYFRYKKLDDLKNEKWKQLSNSFWISDKGRIKDNKNIELSTNIKNGYYVCSVNGKFKYIHRLVATAFIDNPNSYNIVNHIDNDRLNNNVENLEWCTPKHNTSHAIKFIKLNRKDKIYKVDLNGKLIKSYKTITEAAKDENIHQTSMSGRIKRKTAVDNKYIFTRDYIKEETEENEEEKEEDITEYIKINKDYTVFKYNIKTKKIVQSFITVKEAAESENIFSPSMSKRIKLGTIKNEHIFSKDNLLYGYNTATPTNQGLLDGNLMSSVQK